MVLNPENNRKLPDKLLKRLTDILFYSAIFIFIVALAFPHNPAGNWYQQFLPVPTGGQIRDLVFVDSLLGFAVSDSSIIKTINGGDNWVVKQNGYNNFNRIQFLDANTGFVCAGNNKLYKTTNSGENWTIIIPASIFPNDMAVVSEDTIFLVNSEGAFGGVFRTTNGGASWTQVNLAPNNPDRIYMFNARIGFVSNTSSSQLRKTTDGGLTWNIVSGTGTGSFKDLYFIDSLTGWKAGSSGGWIMGKTTDGGFNWIEQFIPTGNNLVVDVKTFSNINSDTLWAGGGFKFFPGNGNRGILYFTSNGGDTWHFQLPDTSYKISQFPLVNFTNRLNGWGYNVTNQGGVHTTNGGDTTFYLGIQQISNNIPKEFELKQNYPNPFNPKTIIPFSLKRSANVKLIAYDITGREIQIMVDEKLQAGEYQADFIGKFLSSGIYFYSLIIDGEFIDTKKMILIK